MNRLYLVVPTVLVLLFGGVYFRHVQAARTAARAAAANIEYLRQKENAEQQIVAEKAKADAVQRLAAQRAEEMRAADEKHAKWDADNARIAVDTADNETKAAALAAQLTRLETELTELRASKVRLSRETFALEKANELALIAKRNSDFEIQNLTAVLTRRAAALVGPVGP